MDKEISDLVIFLTASLGSLTIITLGISYLADDFMDNSHKYINFFKKVSDSYSKQYFNSIPNLMYKNSKNNNS